MSEHIMDDWKLKIRPVVRLERPIKRFVDIITAVNAVVLVSQINYCNAVLSVCWHI